MSTSPPAIPISKVVITEDEEALVLEVLRSGQIAQGPRVEELEQLFSDATETTAAVAVSSGTAALFLSLEALELQPGDEVITSPLTFVATLNARSSLPAPRLGLPTSETTSTSARRRWRSW